MSLSGVLFDLWGTLVPPFPKREHRAALTACLNQLGIPFEGTHGTWSEAGIRRALGQDRTMAEHFGWIAQRRGVAVPSSNLSAAEKIYLQFTLEGLVPADGALEALLALEQAKVPLGVVSNCGPDVPQVWSRTPLARFFDARAFSCEVGAVKPGPVIYERALTALNLDPRQTLYVGDGSNQELTGAARLGMHPLLVNVVLSNTYDPDRQDVAEWQGDRVSSIWEVPPLLGLRTEYIWRGSAAICVDQDARVLLVHGGDEGDVKRWGLPGGGLKDTAESFEACSEREVLEETGCRVAVERLVRVKTHSPALPSAFQCRIFDARLIGGVPRPQDPDGEIDRTGWFSGDELGQMDFHFPEDRDMVLNHLRGSPSRR